METGIAVVNPDTGRITRRLLRLTGSLQGIKSSKSHNRKIRPLKGINHNFINSLFLILNNVCDADAVRRLKLFAFCLLNRSRSLDMAVKEDSGKTKRSGKMFGSLERGLDKVITMLTPSKRRALRDGPRKIKVRACGSVIPSSVLYFARNRCVRNAGFI